MSTSDLIKVVKSFRGPVYIPFMTKDDWWYIQVVKSDLLRMLEDDPAMSMGVTTLVQGKGLYLAASDDVDAGLL